MRCKYFPFCDNKIALVIDKHPMGVKTAPVENYWVPLNIYVFFFFSSSLLYFHHLPEVEIMKFIVTSVDSSD